MKLSKLVLAVTLPVIAGYALSKSYIHYKTRAAVERLVEQASIFGDLTYGALSSTLPTGTVKVERLVFNTRGISDSISIGSVSISTGGFITLMKLALRSDSKQPPESLAVRFDDVRLTLDGPLLQFVNRMAQASAQATGVPQTSAHCGNQNTNGLAIISRLGYDTLIFDGAIDYRIDKRAGSVTVNTEFEARDMGRMKVRMVFAAGDGQPAFTGPPSFKEFDLTYKDLSYKDRLQRFCTRAAKISDAEYVQAELDYGAFRQQLGVILGPGLRAAYRDYLTTANAEVQLRLRPTESFDPTSLKLFRPKDVLAQLGATLSVNNKPVQDLSFDYGTPAPAIARAPAETAAPKEKTAEKPARPAVPARRSPDKEPSGTPEYRAVPVKDLGRYVNYEVRLHEIGQEPRLGVLLQITGNTALIERRYGTGTITIKVPLTRVARAEVLR